MKKIFKYLLIAGIALTLVACSAGKTSGKNTAGNNDVDLKVKNGMYVLPRDESSDSKYLALNIEIKNKSNKTLNLTTRDINLYNSDDEKVKPIQVYDSSNKFQTFAFESISKKKSASGYVVFEVKPKEKYKLHYSPLDFGTGQKGSKDIELKVDASKYPDNVDKVTDLAKEYIEKVFLSGNASGKASKLSTSQDSDQAAITLLAKKDDKNADFTLGGDLEKDRNEFVKKFIDKLGKSFTYYKPTEAELRTFVEAYAKVNAKRAKISYKVKTFLPETAVVYVRPETIGLKNLRTYDLISKFVDEHKGEYTEYNDAYKAAEKYILENAPSQFESLPLVTNNSVSRDGYEVKLVRKGNKWTVDTSSDTAYESLMRIFRGNTY